MTLVILLCMMANVLTAHDFEAVNVDGVTIYYNINTEEEGNTVSVAGSQTVSTLSIPSTVYNNNIEYSVTSIGYEAFRGCTTLTNIELPNSIKRIGYRAFLSCTNLVSIDLPNSVTTIEESAFQSCLSLAKVEIPSSVTRIHKGAFSYCHSITDLTLDCPTIESWFDMTNVKSIKLGNSVTTIGQSAFSYCPLTSIEIPQSVTSIGSYAFSNSGLEGIELPNSVKSVGYWAFTNCDNLKVAKLGDGLTFIGSCAFSDCENLTELTIGNNVTTIQSNAFSGCSKIEHINIPYTVTSIGDAAFSDCSSLIEVVIRDAVTSIGAGAFSGCTKLSVLDFGNSITAIENGAFWGCESLTKVLIPTTVTDIGEQAFKGCTNLMEVSVPNSVKNIGMGAFSGCTKIEKLYLDCSVINKWFENASLSEIELGDNVVTIGANAFQGAIIQSIRIPNSVTTIGDCAFSCSSLKNIEIPSSVSSIGKGAFEYNENLTSVVIPNSVTTIGKGAFYGCDNIETVYSLITKVPTIDENSFSEIVFNNANLYVPKGKKVTYQGTNYWSKFLNISEGAPTEVGDLDGSYTLNVTDAGMATMYLDYDVAIPDNPNLLGVFYCENIINHILYLKRLKETIPANCGVIVMANPGKFTFKETIMSTENVEQNMLTGTTVKVNTADISGDVYTLGRGKNSGYMGFFKFTGKTLPANKAYLVMNEDEEDDDVLVIDRNSYTDIFDDATGLSGIVIKDNEKSVVYDLQGRRVENPTQGIYIVNGKKMYIK